MASFLYIVLVLVLVCSSCYSLKITNKFLSKIVIASSSLLISSIPLNVNAIDSVYVGQYRDVSHKGCSRVISAKESTLLITGSDHKNGSGKWAIRAKENANDGGIIVDFTNGVVLQDWHSPAIDFPSSFEGRQDVNGVFDKSINGIKWSDGNVWY